MKLNKGDTVYVVAPSGNITKDDLEELDNGKRFLEGLSLNVLYDQDMQTEEISKKIESLNIALSSNANMVIAACGGEGAINVIKGIKIDKIKFPKIIAGFSDITSIINYIYLATGEITYHACNLKTLGRAGERKIDNICFSDFKNSMFEEKYAIENENFKCIKEGMGEGILIGGNLTCFLQLANIYKIDLENKILFLEDLGYETPIEDLKSKLKLLTEVHNFARIQGIILGNYEVETKDKIEDAAKEAFEKYNFPIIKTDSFGHGKTNLVMPIGKKVHITSKDNKVNFKIDL